MHSESANPRVLVVDDEPNLRISLAATLFAEGYDVVLAGDGQEALEKLSQSSFDLLLTDIRMPQKNGFELFREARLLIPHLPVVMMTAFANEHLIEEALAAGIFTIVYKPFDMDRMLELIATVLHRPLILIVDGLLEEGESILTALRNVGLHAELAQSGEAALKLLQQSRVDVCVLDLETAGGLQVAQLIEQQRLSYRIIAITGDTSPELLRQAGPLSAARCLRRPLVLPEFIRTLARARQLRPERSTMPSAMSTPVPPASDAAPPDPRQQILEQVRSELRHSLSNRLVVIRTSAFYLHKALQRHEMLRVDPKMEQMLRLIDEEVAHCIAWFDGAPASSGSGSAAIAPPKVFAAQAEVRRAPNVQEDVPLILIVDDAENNRLSLQALLEDCGFRVDGAASVAEARARISAVERRYRLVLLDQHLPDGLGTELIGLIRQCHPESRIILTSGSAGGEGLKQSAQLVDAVVPKGGELPELLDVVERLLMAAESEEPTPTSTPESSHD